MESRFASLHVRDNSVMMLRVKQSKRRSQCQKENRGKVVHSRRQLDHSSAGVIFLPVVPEEKPGNIPAAVKNRLQSLQQWKEQKTLEKEKEKREKKVFKTGLYQPKDCCFGSMLQQVPTSRARTKEAPVKSSSSSQPLTSRVTRSMRLKALVPLKQPVPAVKKGKLTGGLITRSRAAALQTLMGTRTKPSVTLTELPLLLEECALASVPAVESSQAEARPLTATSVAVVEEKEVEDVTTHPQPVEALSSFAPKDFAPAGLLNYRLLLPPGPQQPEHTVPYFRQQLELEMEKLTSLSQLWEARVDNQAIPEEMRDRMRTSIGQARLLMKERFAQFSGLVDDCELQRGDKVTTCSDLQGFWEMVYYQVEDVAKKFAALKEAESRDWVDEQEPVARRAKKLVKKLPPTEVAPKPMGDRAAGKSRLAAAKAAMKARKQAEEAPPQGPETVLFQESFFPVESPARLPGSVRRSARLKHATTPSNLPSSVVVGTPASPARQAPGPPEASSLSCSLSPCPAHRTPTRPASGPSRSTLLSSPEIEYDVPGLDFERYLQPSESCRRSPAALETGSPAALETGSPAALETGSPAAMETGSPVAMEMGQSPMAMEMGQSPMADSKDLLPLEEAGCGPAGRLHVKPSAITPQAKQAPADLLLYTPDLQDRIRVSMCPSDLMVFSPL